MANEFTKVSIRLKDLRDDLDEASPEGTQLNDDLFRVLMRYLGKGDSITLEVDLTLGTACLVPLPSRGILP